uniref:Global nitrogen transcriptional regulator n=1 Tax=Porphyridium sordidum TaxID=28024 RepID=A0A1C9CDR1_PORSO|nr:global nitrogen transcriptional regulator [Porphyridium sordidum]AOM66484.1 global nitrogen transcriptional regulator [Porphyridium sordidum]
MFTIITNMKHNYAINVKFYNTFFDSMQTLLDILIYKESHKRFRALLLLLAKNIGIYTKFGIVITYSLSYQDIADIVGSNRVTITRIINDLNYYKIISIYKRKLILHDPILFLTIK